MDWKWIESVIKTKRTKGTKKKESCKTQTNKKLKPPTQYLTKNQKL